MNNVDVAIEKAKLDYQRQYKRLEWQQRKVLAKKLMILLSNYRSIL